jgi:hypothetical protein
MDFSEIRKYRIDGIALFDLFTAFFGTFLLDYFFNISNLFNKYSSSPKIVLYLLVIPFGILVHLTISQSTFLNTQLFNNDINIYKILLIINIILIIQNLNK